MTLESPKYSFVQFDGSVDLNNCCDENFQFCLMAIDDTDNYFQVKVTGNDIAETNTLWSTPTASFELLLLSGTGANLSNYASRTLRNWTSQDGLLFDKYRTGLTEIIYVWRKPFKDFKNFIQCEQCFQVAISAFSSVYFSNCFKRACKDCYTSVFDFTNDENYAEYNYCNTNSFANRVRLPIFLAAPKIIEDKAVYRRSNGTIKQNKSILTNEYQAVTEYFNKPLHDKIAVLFAHDSVSITGNEYTGSISKSSAYDIEWTEGICYAPAKFNVLTSPFALRNNNCGECEPVVLPPNDPDDPPDEGCNITISSIGILYQDETGTITYNMVWTNSAPPASVIIEISYDNITWYTPINYDSSAVLTGLDSATWKTLNNEPFDFYLRLTPVCSGNVPGTPTTYHYEV